MSFDIDICELYNDDEFMEQWPNFEEELHENPTWVLNCMKLVIHQVCLLLCASIFCNIFIFILVNVSFYFNNRAF